MHPKNVARFASLAFAIPLLLGCSQSEYDSCKDSASGEWKANQRELVENGGENSVGGYMESQESYIADECGSESDYT